jgi:hypothetical protein
MRLLSLHLTNVRKFTGKRASITGIGRGITVVSEANEFGKSTFFDAVHALFFEKYGSAAKPVKSLQPYAGGAVDVSADIETDQGQFRVEKRFLAKKMARITRLSDNATIAQDDEAERWISTLLGAVGDGPAGLLWVRQGLVGLEPDNAKEKSQLTETRRDLLSSVAGEIDAMTGGRRMDKVMRRLADDLAEIATKTGRQTGPWKAATDEVKALAEQLDSVTAQVTLLETALEQRKVDEALISRMDDPVAKARRDTALLAADTALEEARAHAGRINTARQDRDIAALHAKGAMSDLDGFLAAIATLISVSTQAQITESKALEAEAEALSLHSKAMIAQEKSTTARRSLALARANLDAARFQATARKAQAEAVQLHSLITKAEAAQQTRDGAAARVKASAATSDWLTQAEAQASTVARLEALHHAQSTTLRMDYSGAARIALNGAALEAGAVLPLSGEVQLDLPGIGKMTLNAPPASGVEALTRARTQLEQHLAQAGADTVASARGLAGARADAARQADLAMALLETFAPEGIAALHAAKAIADLAAADAHDAALQPLAELQVAAVDAEAVDEQAAKALRAADAAHSALREAAIKARAAADTAALRQAQAAASAGPAEAHEDRRADYLRATAIADETLKMTEARLAKVATSAPDLATTEAELKRAQDTALAATKLRAQVAERLAAVSAQIRTLAGNGIEERRDEINGQLETARASEARLARKFAALTRLQQALEAERTAAQETYFGPVQAELKPLLSILHRDAALSFDSASLLPTGLTRGLAEEGLEDLSGGTREQIAILTRLAFARLFARQGRHMPIILDDALVYSDDDRIIKMFTALTRIAQDQQIIVFSCRQLAFQDLGGARPKVEVCDV